MDLHDKQNFSKESTIGAAALTFMVLASIFVASLVLTNIIAGKYFVLMGLPISCSTLVYPFTFLITDIITEVYGPKKAKMLVLIGFTVSMMTTVLVLIAKQLPIAANSPIDQAAFSQVLGLLPGFVIGSMVAYLVAQFVDVHIFEYLRALFKQKNLWIRNNGSTLVSQLLDTIIATSISLVIWPMLDGNAATQPINWQLYKNFVMGQYLFKCFLALLDTPFVYAGTYFIKRWIGSQPASTATNKLC